MLLIGYSAAMFMIYSFEICQLTSMKLRCEYFPIFYFDVVCCKWAFMIRKINKGEEIEIEK